MEMQRKLSENREITVKNTERTAHKSKASDSLYESKMLAGGVSFTWILLPFFNLIEFFRSIGLYDAKPPSASKTIENQGTYINFYWQEKTFRAHPAHKVRCIIKTMVAKKCETAKKTMEKVRKNYGKMSQAQKNEPKLNIDARMAKLLWVMSTVMLMHLMLFFSLS